MIVKYEDLAGNELKFCEKLQSMLQIPIYSNELRSFDFYHKMRPSLTRKGSTVGWEENYSKEQLHLLWETHGTMMQHFEYGEPNYNLGLDEALY